ncbi:hypothetical protein [Paraburkholderia sp. BR14320]|uniref:hypothetical protein n=1 Tax=unclassified Paraburkholderia TaxID=2615204 RepID=UPI0034CD883D
MAPPRMRGRYPEQVLMRHLSSLSGQILQVAPGLQYGTASQRNSGDQGNVASATAYSNPLAAGLESLARAVGAESSQTGEASGSSDTGSTTSVNDVVSKLEQDFTTLFGSSGADNGTSLQTFLQTFASNVAELSASRFAALLCRHLPEPGDAALQAGCDDVVERPAPRMSHRTIPINQESAAIQT